MLPLALALVHASYTVTLATTAAAALTVIRQQAVQCLVTDLEMPQVNGVRLCQMIRSQPAFADLPIVLVSSAPEPIERVRCWSTYFRKPVPIANLLDAVNRYAAARLAYSEAGENVAAGVAQRFHPLKPQTWPPVRWSWP